MIEIKELICNINRGGFGVIDKVRLKDRSIVARKTFDPVNKENFPPETIDKFRRRFIREVAIQQNLPNNLFIPVLHSSLEGDAPWFLMPVATRVYEQEIQLCKETGVPHPDGLSDILNSLEHLHKLGYVHRDLKPQNILFHDGQWKLSDLGLISADSKLLSKITSTDAFAGTELYCAPEQVTAFTDVNHQADIYSFGAILHDIFDGGKRVPYSKLMASGSIGFIIEKCTENVRENRFNDINSLRNSLLSVLSKGVTEVSVNKRASEWIEKLGNSSSWNYDDFETFVFYLNRTICHFLLLFGVKK
jgi:serine/threonine protein kinase